MTPHEQQLQKAALSGRFDQIFTNSTGFETLNQVLQRLWRRKPELLKVLDRPDLPLHNNASEQDIREFVTKRKISGSTRSDQGRRCRDTFASLKKTVTQVGNFLLGIPYRSNWGQKHNFSFGGTHYPESRGKPGHPRRENLLVYRLTFGGERTQAF